MSLSVKQLASLIALGGDLPEIQFKASVSKDMLPLWDNPPSSLMEQIKKAESDEGSEGGHTGQKLGTPSEIVHPNLTGRGGSSTPPPDGGGFSK